MKAIKLFFLLSIYSVTSMAQEADSLLNAFSSDTGSQAVDAVFKATRVVLSHSTETQKRHDLDLRIRHHFGDIGGKFGSVHTLYGLDLASDLFIGLDYGISDDLTVAIGRSKNDELFNFSGKYRLLKQKRNAVSPVNLTLFGQVGLVARAPFNESEFVDYSDRLSYFLQAIISRKLSQRLSLQVMPGILMRKNMGDPDDADNLVVVGFAGRMKLTKRLSFVADYSLVNGISRPSEITASYYNPLGVGLEIETGGHIFSLNFMNSEYIIENSFLANTRKSWNDGGVRFGFTISRNFTLFKSKNRDPNTN